ncbi:hypothetical protein ABKN59_002833 [Abortiporus biennis]
MSTTLLGSNHTWLKWFPLKEHLVAAYVLFSENPQRNLEFLKTWLCCRILIRECVRVFVDSFVYPKGGLPCIPSPALCINHIPFALLFDVSQDR